MTTTSGSMRKQKTHLSCKFRFTRLEKERKHFDSSGDSDDDFDAIKQGSGLGGSADPSVLFYPEQYCPIVEAMRTICFEASLLELFAVKGRFDETSERMISELTDEKLLDLVNNATVSGLYMLPRYLRSSAVIDHLISVSFQKLF